MSERDDLQEAAGLMDELEARGFSGVLAKDGFEFRVGPDQHLSPYVSLHAEQGNPTNLTYIITEKDFRNFVRDNSPATSAHGTETKAGSAWNTFVKFDPEFTDYLQQNGIDWRVTMPDKRYAVTVEGVLFLFGSDQRVLNILESRQYKRCPNTRQPWLALGEHLEDSIPDA